MIMYNFYEIFLDFYMVSVHLIDVVKVFTLGRWVVLSITQTFSHTDSNRCRKTKIVAFTGKLPYVYERILLNRGFYTSKIVK